MVFCEEVVEDEPATKAQHGRGEQSPFVLWLIEQLASRRDPSLILRDIGAAGDDVCWAEARLRLEAFASDSTYGATACEIVRRRCSQLKMRVPFPFAVWLREREANGATARQILSVLGMKISEEGTMGEEERWVGLRELAREDDAWDIVGRMVSASFVDVLHSRSTRVAVSSMDELTGLISSCQRILILSGAGISASCGLPTFRDGSGWREAVAAEFGLASADEVSDIATFRRDPRPCFRAHKKILPGTCKPSPTHRFIRALEDHGKLLRLYTQNVDTLEVAAGITRVTFCHGSFASATCTSCGHRAPDVAEVNATIAQDAIPYCHLCGAVVKPDVILFGEPMPAGVREGLEEDTASADLLLVLGTSLNVAPCCLVPSLVGAAGDAPRILINKEPAGREADFEGFFQMPCDDAVAMLGSALGFPPVAAENAAAGVGD